MKMENIKTESQLPIGKKLVSADAVFIDGSLKRVTLNFEENAKVEITIRSYDVLMVAVEAPPKLVERHKVSGKLYAADLTQTFSDAGDARRYHEKLEGTHDVEGVVTEKVMLPEEEPVLNDIPF